MALEFFATLCTAVTKRSEELQRAHYASVGCVPRTSPLCSLNLSNLAYSLPSWASIVEVVVSALAKAALASFNNSSESTLNFSCPCISSIR
jgi:hypothetical protein